MMMSMLRCSSGGLGMKTVAKVRIIKRKVPSGWQITNDRRMDGKPQILVITYEGILIWAQTGFIQMLIFTFFATLSLSRMNIFFNHYYHQSSLMVNRHKAVIAVFWRNVEKSRPSSRPKKYLIISCSITRSCCPFHFVHLTSSRRERCFRMQINECEHLLLISSLCSHSAWSYSWDTDKSFGVHIRVSHNWLQRGLNIHQRDPSLRIREHQAELHS